MTPCHSPSTWASRGRRRRNTNSPASASALPRSPTKGSLPTLLSAAGCRPDLRAGEAGDAPQGQRMTGVMAVTGSEQEDPSFPQPAPPVRGPQQCNSSINSHGSNGNHAGNRNALSGYGGPVRLATDSWLKVSRWAGCSTIGILRARFGLEFSSPR